MVSPIYVPQDVVDFAYLDPTVLCSFTADTPKLGITLNFVVRVLHVASGIFGLLDFGMEKTRALILGRQLDPVPLQGIDDLKRGDEDERRPSQSQEEITNDVAIKHWPREGSNH
ncbi:hypothetical protein EYZ11_010902 [Aspergillus tanneri]|uniref:Uncharacterized protein n=1 Tax=Aspergillus tanneri TaxID=1220188 RepID=A0A4S3J6C7_9EURO|nr:hypothetical protein EYZ11_010902 [Aspergillus tanneri]